MTTDPRMGRREFLRRGGIAAAAGTLGAGAIAAGIGLGGRRARPSSALAANPTLGGYPGSQKRHFALAATDGWITRPVVGSENRDFVYDDLAADGTNTFCYGFRNVTGFTTDEVFALKGQAQQSAPILWFDEGDEIFIKLTNLGFSQRPDLVDGHTLHWHGFRNAIPYFDGVPETSLAVPIGRTLEYYYVPRDPGTYMYHCHFEDVEHVQMGMTGVLFVQPRQNLGNPGKGIAPGKYVYNDGDGSTAFDREFTLFLSDWWLESHWKSSHIQQPDWSDFQAQAWLMNGRQYPDTLLPSHDVNRNNESSGGVPTGDPITSADQPDLYRLRYQPFSSLIQANAGERVLLRMANLGYQRHALTLPGIPLNVVGKDSMLLRGRNGEDLSYRTDTIDIAPGESFDVIFEAPSTGGGVDAYPLYGRDFADDPNRNDPGYGGQATEVRIHPAGALPPQTAPNT